MMTNKAPFRFAIVLTLVLIFTYLTSLTYSPFLGIDDAYIYFVYAKNFVAGHGFVYNVHGEHVEGFTSFLWMWVIIFCYWISKAYFQWILLGLGILMISYALYRLVEWMESSFFNISKIEQTSPAPIISIYSLFFLAFLLIPAGYIDWTIYTLMDTGVWSVLIILIVLLLFDSVDSILSHKKQLYFSMLIILLVLTRPESLLWGIAFLVLYGFLNFKNTGKVKNSLLFSAPPLFCFLATLGLLILFRLHYFGYPFPNTFYAKISSNWFSNLREGITYFFFYIFVYPIHVIPLIYILLSGAILARKYFLKNVLNNADHYQLIIVSIVWVSFLVTLYSGGDHFPLLRFYQPSLPILFLSLFNFPFILNNIGDLKIKLFLGKKTYAILLILTIPFIYLSNQAKIMNFSRIIPYKASLIIDFELAYFNKNESIKINDFMNRLPYYPSIGRIAAGGYAYTYKGNTIDLLGLNNTLMAHAKKEKIGFKNHASFDTTAFYLLKPAILNAKIIEANTKIKNLDEDDTLFVSKRISSHILEFVYRSPRFRLLYKAALITNTNTGMKLYGYYRNDILSYFKKYHYKVDILTQQYDIEKSLND